MDIFFSAGSALQQAFSLIFQPTQFAFLAGGVLLGLSVGVFPGLGGIAGLSLVIPFLYGADPVSGLALMVGLVAVIPTSDTFASVLMGIPGSSASQATVLDGFPLARKGEAAKALSAAFVSSLFGGLLGALVLTFLILAARPIILAFGTPELLAVTLLGLSMVGVLSGRVPLKGLASAGLGLIVGTIGAAPALGSARLSSHSWPYLYDGLQLVIVGLGLFALPEIVALLRQDRSISNNATLGAGWLEGVQAWFENIWLSVRCAFIGVLVGIIPGLGGSVVDWIAYGHTVQTSKNKEEFGEGDIRGVIGPESSNNAKEGGGLAPTLLFGIPGSGSMAVFLGGLVLLGYEAGPQLITNDLPVIYTIVWSLALANVLGAGLCIVLSGPISRLTTIPFVLLAPFLFIMIVFASIQLRQSLGDLVALTVIGLLGIFLRRFDWSRPAFLIGFVLSGSLEVYTYQAVQLANIKLSSGISEMLSFVFSPLSCIIIISTAISLWISIRHRQVKSGGLVGGVDSRWMHLVFAWSVFIFFGVSFVDALMVPVFNDRVFPLVISGLSLLVMTGLLFAMYRTERGDLMFFDQEFSGEDAQARNGLWSTFAWFALLPVFAAIFGFVIGLVLFLMGYFILRARLHLVKAVVLTSLGCGGVIVAAYVLNRNFPPGLLQQYVDLPWPLR